MKKRILAWMLAILCVLAVLPAASATDTVACLTVDSSLVIIGDSNTVYLKKHNPDIQPARIYARVNATIVECVENYSRYHADGYDKGLYQLISALSGSSFKTVVINIGTNNAGTPADTFKGYYRTLLQNLYDKNANAVIYLCKILPINPSHYDGAYPNVFTHANINKINNAVSELQAEFAAKGYDARIMDLNTPFKNAAGNLMPEYDLGGGIHLTIPGYKRLNLIVQTALAQGDPNANHSWGSPSVLQAATCTEPGRTKYSCSVCGAERLETIPASGSHSWDGGSTVIAAGCTAAGRLRYRCTRCGQIREETLPALGHAWAYTETLTPSEGESHGRALYTCTRCNETKEGRLCAGEVFTDMPADGNWAHAPIDWAYFSGITAGKTSSAFAPKDTVTRAEALTFLWTAMGSPAPERTALPFTDVKAGKYYYEPVLWALEHGITSGVSERSFGVKQQCTRAQIMTFLWTAAGKPEPLTTENPFKDVPEDKYYYKAVLWGVENSITGGVAEDRFGPNQSCTRAQVVTFLYHAKALLNVPAQEP